MKLIIDSVESYQQIMERIENCLQKATSLGGFENLSIAEKEELRRLSLLAEHYEDSLQH
jgi:hypothetical protein